MLVDWWRRVKVYIDVETGAFLKEQLGD